MFIQTIPLAIATSLKNCLFSIDRCHCSSTIFCSCFFPQKGMILFFYFSHIFNKIVKPKCKRSFTELLKDYICYIFIVIIISNISNHSKLRDFQKCSSLKNKRVHRLWRSPYAISAYREVLKIHIFPLLVVFNGSNENMLWIF